MSRTMQGAVINIHEHGATVRLEDGSLVAVSARELESNRPTYVSARDGRKALAFVIDRHGRHALAALAQSGLAVDSTFEQRIGAYLKETEAWAPPDRPEPAERHFIRKKRRAALFEARKRPT